jgi:hypothetical protein
MQAFALTPNHTQAQKHAKARHLERNSAAKRAKMRRFAHVGAVHLLRPQQLAPLKCAQKMPCGTVKL